MLRGRANLVLIELKSVPDEAGSQALAAVYRRYRPYRWTALTSFLPGALTRVSFLPVARGLVARTAPSPAQARGYAFVAVRHDRLSRSQCASTIPPECPSTHGPPTRPPTGGAWPDMASTASSLTKAPSIRAGQAPYAPPESPDAAIRPRTATPRPSTVPSQASGHGRFALVMAVMLHYQVVGEARSIRQFLEEPVHLLLGVVVVNGGPHHRCQAAIDHVQERRRRA